jgi:4-hydroxymandelate oxidase
MSDADLLNLFDYERLAVERLPQLAYDYFASGAHDELTLRANREAFERIALLPRVLVDVSERDSSVELFGRRHPLPLVIAPMAFAKMADPAGEAAIARAAGEAGVAMTLSTLATTSIEDVATAASGALWYQLYVFRDREVTRSLVERAEAAGYEALVLTVDAPVLGRRERDARNRFVLPEGLFAENLVSEEQRSLPSGEGSGLEVFFNSQLDASLTWADVDWLRSITRLPVLVKGVLRADDAKLAVEHSAAGVIVSNHGGRQLDTAVASIDALPAVAKAVDGRAAVLVDGGVRRGTDILKALARGADAVLVGRPLLWGLAVDGEAGAAEVLRILREEFELAMALCGCTSVDAIDASLLA